MSLILDALKRSEQERQGQPASITASRHTIPPASRWPAGRWLIAALLINCALIAAVYFWFSGDPGISEQLDTSHSEQPDYPLEKPLFAVKNQPRPLAVEADIIAAKSPLPLRAQARMSATADSSVQISTAQEPSLATADEVTELDAAYIPTIGELPDRIQMELASLELNAHVYSSSPEKRFVLINMQKYRQGQTVSGTQYRIQEITSQGVVIDYGKGEALLKARR